MSPADDTPATSLPRRVYNALFRIRAKLLLVHAFVAIVPFAGLRFVRTYERELLRSEEEGMTAVASAVAAGSARELDAGRPLASATTTAAARAAARGLRAQVRVLDAAGHAVLDTGPERVEVQTSGRRLVLESVPSREYASAPVLRDVGDPDPPDGAFATREEVRRALAGTPASFTRISTRVRGVRLYFAQPIRAGDGRVAGAVYVSRTTYPVLVSLYRVRNGLTRVAAYSLAVAAAVALFLALTISRPLHKLTVAARRIAAGERGVALKISGRDEVATLARAFDAMARELDARLEYISELAANVSHEFKTPIASIRGAAELLRDGAADDPAARGKFLGNILDDTARLGALVTRLLELSRVEARRAPPVELDYRALVEDVVARYQEAGLPVALTYIARATDVRGDATQLESALRNLVDNAVRFSPPGGAVEVTVAAAEGDRLTTTVRDHGRGISAANQARVWDRFFTTARAQGGTGLGLAIVRAVVEAHGGAVGVRSDEGAGSAFWFTLPRRM